MEHSILGKLPPELRVMVYELALTNPNPVVMGFRRRVERSKSNMLALTATCKLIRAESLPIFYQKNEFVFLHAGKKWMSKIGKHYAKSIRNVTHEKSFIIDPAKDVEQDAERRSFAVKLASLVRFFRKTGKKLFSPSLEP